MAGTAVVPKFATWSAPGLFFRIEYSPAVLDEIRMTAVEGYHRVPHGGVETGGILFGTRIKNGVRIKAWRPIACEYAKGPSFVLSAQDETGLVEMLKSWRSHPDLANLEPAGWYRAHTRSEILLPDSDLAFFNRFFPQPWQVCLIVRPASFAPTRAGFFFREGDGSIRTQSSYREFVLAPLPLMPPVPDEPPVETAVEPPPAPAPVIAAPEPPHVQEIHPEPKVEPEPPPSKPQPIVMPRPASPAPRRVRLPNRYLYATAAIVLALIMGIWLLRPSHKGLSLSATDLSGQLLIAWDRAARPIARATGGSIEIDDRGVHTQVKLTPADLRSGNISYARQSGDVSVRMTLDVPDGPPVAEMTRFLRPGQSPQPQQQPPAPRVEVAKQPAPEPPHETAKAEPEPQKPEKRPEPAAAVEAAAPPPAKRIATFRAPQPRASKANGAVPNIAPPSIDSLPSSPQQGALPAVLGSATPAAPVAPPAAAKGPTAGRIIWTGKLAKNGRLVVEGNHASVGALVGSLPGNAARVNAYPGDLTAGGITLFTSDPRYSTPQTEAAGADNGWNATTYTLDRKRAAGIRILEQPSAKNGHRLVLESDAKLSVVVIEWHAQ